jgi:hypothetical protein
VRTLAALLLVSGLVLAGAGCGRSHPKPTPVTPDACLGQAADTATAPEGARFASLPRGASIDLTTGAIDASGGTGDLRYAGSAVAAIGGAPCGISLWTDYYAVSPTALGWFPPGWSWTDAQSTNGAAGTKACWIKLADGRYATIYCVAVRPCYFDCFYIAPAGTGTWSDMARPAEPTLESVSTGAATGTIDVLWDISLSQDVEGYLVLYGLDGQNWTRVYTTGKTASTLGGLVSGARYYVTVVAYDHEGNTSPLPMSIAATAK